ncbi:hypothetical protein B9J07_13580 [Sinorhizobium sp. LM21]|nr:hypothetical protein B9J07_13580 [Sinorhizobium sp. LM21]
MSNVEQINRDRRLLWSSGLHFGGDDPTILIVLPDGRVQRIQSGGEEMEVIDLSRDEAIEAMLKLFPEIRGGH